MDALDAFRAEGGYDPSFYLQNRRAGDGFHDTIDTRNGRVIGSTRPPRRTEAVRTFPVPGGQRVRNDPRDLVDTRDGHGTVINGRTGEVVRTNRKAPEPVTDRTFRSREDEGDDGRRAADLGAWHRTNYPWLYGI